MNIEIKFTIRDGCTNRDIYFVRIPCEGEDKYFVVKFYKNQVDTVRPSRATEDGYYTLEQREEAIKLIKNKKFVCTPHIENLHFFDIHSSLIEPQITPEHLYDVIIMFMRMEQHKRTTKKHMEKLLQQFVTDMDDELETY